MPICGRTLVIDLLPDVDLIDILIGEQRSCGRRTLKTVLTRFLPKRLVAARVPADLAACTLQALSYKQFSKIAAMLQQWTVKPGGTEGYRTAEVTLWGVDCDAISSKTMEARQVPGSFLLVKFWMSPVGWGAIISSGPGPPDGAPANIAINGFKSSCSRKNRGFKIINLARIERESCIVIPRRPITQSKLIILKPLSTQFST